MDKIQGVVLRLRIPVPILLLETVLFIIQEEGRFSIGNQELN